LLGSLGAVRRGRVDPDVVKARKANYGQVKENIRASYFGFELNFIPKSVLDASPDERERVFNEMWDNGGFPFWLGNYQDMFFSKEANDVCAQFLRVKIREIVKDPAVAEKLIPTTYPYGTKRQPLDTNYFEPFNKPNVTLVDVNETPITQITAAGLRTSDAEYAFDIIVFGTGFDAMTGPLKKIDFRGRGGEALADAWADGPQAIFGKQRRRRDRGDG
jgi:cation diffusion facilitator CzcD-associated flavoprotein CzcO